jgi:hypothetical protein
MKNRNVLLSTLKQVSFKTLILGVSLTTLAAQDAFGQIPVPGPWFSPNWTTTTKAVGIGTNAPAGWEEIRYCDDTQNGLVVTNTACPYSQYYPISFDGVAEPVFAVEPGGGGGGPVVPYPTADFTLRPYGTFLGNSHPMMWARMENNLSFYGISSGSYSSRFMVCPNGVAGINIEAPRATFDIKSLGAYNYPGLIVGRQQLGSSTRTQHAMFVPLLADDGYNTISQKYDQGMFFTDGKGTNGSNLSGSFIIAPWADPNNSANIGGLKIDNLGNLQVHGTVKATGLNLAVKWWSDFVFAPNYKPMSLLEIEKYIKTNGHLPGIPSACELEESGVNVADMQAVHMQKIEELTLYAINQEKKIVEQQEQLDELAKKQTEQDAQLQNQQAEIDQLKQMLDVLLKK